MRGFLFNTIMILSDRQIYNQIQKGNIKIEPFDVKNIGSNSYDLHLSNCLARYTDLILDAKKENEIEYITIPESGYTLQPGTLYLGSTIEYTESYKHVPIIEGKSSIARLGIQVHLTAGFGDIGFFGHWTLEILVAQPVIVYPNMPICQIYWHKAGKCLNPYYDKNSAKYSDQESRPVPSMMFKNFEK